MIRFEDVYFHYNKHSPNVLQEVNFTLERGGYYFLTGPSGAGKTSLINLMFLGKIPSKGKITMFGQDTNTASRKEMCTLRQNIGVVFQDFRLLNHLSAFDNVALPLRILNRPDNEIKNHVSELLDWVGLEDHKQNLPETLSGGQQQR
ncbi:MAG: ATP-binding cassette domain-containing protein, partial [Alphaproteobacteria bacterium]|nr:ATP-binding cassette domain-containing protein [Alphaproteobacteria bacterium]